MYVEKERGTHVRKNVLIKNIVRLFIDATVPSGRGADDKRQTDTLG